MVKTEFTFDNFDVTPYNNFAYSTCLEASLNPGKKYNPIMLYGPTWCGKTHLLKAMHNKFSELFPQKSVLHISMMDFIEPLIDGMSDEEQGKPNGNCLYDVLIVDDLFYLSGRPSIQRALADLIETYVLRDKQVVLALEGKPDDIYILSNYLRYSPKMQNRVFCNLVCDSMKDNELIMKKSEISTNNIPFDKFTAYYFKNEKNEENAESNMDKLLFFIKQIHRDEIPFTVNSLDEYIGLLYNANKENPQRVQQYTFIRDLLIEKNAEELLPDIFKILYNLCMHKVIAYPALATLEDNYGKFICEICGNMTVENIKNAIKEEKEISRRILLLAVHSTCAFNANVWNNDMNYLSGSAFDNCDLSQTTEGKPDDGFEQLSRMIIKVNSNIFKILKNSKYLPYYYTDDVDRSDTCIGNMITLVDGENSKRTATFQIFDHEYYDTFEDMFNKVDFGFEKLNAKDSAEKCKIFFKDMTLDNKALALCVVRTDGRSDEYETLYEIKARTVSKDTFGQENN